MKAEFRTFLRSAAGVYALVGGTTNAARIYWVKRPQNGAVPDILLHEVSGPDTYTMRGRVRLRGVLVQVDCWGRGDDGGLEAGAIRDAVVAALDALNDAPTETLIAAFIEDRREELDAGEDGDADLYRSSLDVRLWVKD